MATNKHALIRYKVLDKCFANPGKKYFIDDLIEECSAALTEINEDRGNISRRQVLEDIKFMESPEGWNVELNRTRDNRRVYFRYANPDFSINNMPLNETEVNHLKSAMNVLSQFKGMPQFDWIQEILPKLQSGIDNNKAAIMDFDTNPYLKGFDLIGVLYNAIFYKKILQITYQSFESEKPYDVELHPYFLKQYNNRWFLFGYNPLTEKADWNLAVDRIVDITELKKKYRPNKEIDWNEYFDDIIGVTKTDSEKIQEIVLHFNMKPGKYIINKPIHGSQKAKWVEGDKLEVKLNLILNYELERLILSYADEVQVIKPLALKRKVESRLSIAVVQYKRNN